MVLLSLKSKFQSVEIVITNKKNFILCAGNIRKVWRLTDRIKSRVRKPEVASILSGDRALAENWGIANEVKCYVANLISFSLCGAMSGWCLF